MSDFAALSYKELAERLAHYLSSALVSAQYSMTDETMHDALGLCDQVTRRKSAPPQDVRVVVDEPVAWRGCNSDGEVVTEWIDGAPPEKMFDLCGNAASFDKIERAYSHPQRPVLSQCSEVIQQCSEHLRTQGNLLPPRTLLPHPPRHEGFLQPEREVPGYTLDQMKEYGALCAAEALRQNK